MNIFNYRNTAKTFTITVPSSISATTTSVKYYRNTKEQLSFSGSSKSVITASYVAPVATFNLTATDNNIPEAVYFYNIIATAAAKNYVIESGTDTITGSLI